MSYSIATVTNAGGAAAAYFQVLDAIKALMEAAGWTTLRYDNTSANHQWIGHSTGLSGTDDLYVGVYTYFDASADYYNLTFGNFTGYVAANSFRTQPNGQYYSCACHNNAVTYYMSANKQVLYGAMKVGTPVYEHFYLGKLFPYCRPSEWPLPLVIGSSFAAGAATRYSDTSHSFPYPGQGRNFTVRRPDGVWDGVTCMPYYSMGNTTAMFNVSGSQLVPVGTTYQLEPIVVSDFPNTDSAVLNNTWGELDGVYAVSGFNSAVENVIQVGGTLVDQTGMTVKQAVDAIIAASGRAFVVMQDIYRTTIYSYVGLEMK